MPVSLTVEKLSRLRKHDFERFCRALLDADYYARFGKTHVDIDGPSMEDEGDGGYDLLATISQPTTIAAFYPVLRSDRGSTMYSCKSHRSTPEGSPPLQGWIKQVRGNIDPAPAVWDAASGRPTNADLEKVRRGTQPGLTEILDRLCRGDEFFVLVNVETGNRQKYAREFAARFRTRADLLELEGKIRDEQVRVLGAQELVNAFNERLVALDGDLVSQLGGPDAEFLLSWARWTEDISAQRRRMNFVSDEHRDDLHRAMREAVDAAGPSAVWVIGAPGVGKTRAVHEFFDASAALTHRVRASENWPALLDWCDQSDAFATDLIVVADEVPGDRAHELYRKFLRRARGTAATLIMIGTKSGETSGSPRPFELERVEPPEFRRLIEAEFDASGGGGDRARTVALVEGLAQRYPLFAMWLTRGLAENPELLDDPGTDLTDEHDPWTATKLVLANRRTSPDRWNEIAETRGRALLLALLVPDEHPLLPPEDERALSDGLGRTWAQLESAQLECRERGTLRATRYGHVYVSPANLERLILNHYFGRTPTPIDPTRLRERIGDRMDRLLERARNVAASDACRRALALASVESKLAEVEQGDASTDALLWIAAEIPAVVVRSVHALARRVDTGEVPESAAALVGEVLGHLRHRELSAVEFELVEDGLFTLAYRNGEKVRPGPAGDWASLFSSGLHATRQPFDARLSLLRRRLESSDRTARLAAVDGAVNACNPTSRRIALNMGLDDRDEPATGEWLGPQSGPELVRRAALGWELLLQTARDDDAEVADRARRRIAGHLRSGVEIVFASRIDLLEALAAQATTWTSSQRNALGSSLEDVNRYDGEHLAASSDVARALDALATAVAPTSIADRVMAQVGRWNPLPGPFSSSHRLDDEHRADLEVARALLVEPAALWSLREWLDSTEAVRVSAFGFALGEVDQDRALLEELLDCVRASSLVALCASYLAAWAGEDAAAFDRWLPIALDDPALDDTLARAVCASTATDRRVRSLTTLIERGRFDATSLRGIGYWNWAAAVECGRLDELITALVRDGRRELLSQAIGLSRQRLDKGPLDGPLEDRLVELVDATRSGHLVATGERDWARLVRALLQAGRTEVLQSIVRALDDDGYSHQAQRAINELLPTDGADVLWDALLRGLADEPLRVVSLDRILSTAKLQIPVSKVLAWVDANPNRGMIAARLARPYQAKLDPLARGLLERFGPDSRPARSLGARAKSTPTAVHSFASFFDEQARRAESWANEHEGAVAIWANALAVGLRDRAAAEREDETLWRRHG